MLRPQLTDRFSKPRRLIRGGVGMIRFGGRASVLMASLVICIVPFGLAWARRSDPPCSASVVFENDAWTLQCNWDTETCSGSYPYCTLREFYDGAVEDAFCCCDSGAGNCTESTSSCSGHAHFDGSHWTFQCRGNCPPGTGLCSTEGAPTYHKCNCY